MTRPAEAQPDHARVLAALLGLSIPDGAVIAAAPPTRGPAADRPSRWATLAATLPEGGLAVVELDLLPGWHLLRAAREMALSIGAPADVQPSSAVLDLGERARRYAEGAHTAWLTWLDTLRTQTSWMALLDRHEIEPANLGTLIAEARTCGLHWVSDARLANSSLALLPKMARDFAAHDAAVTGDPTRPELVADLVRNQILRVGLFSRTAHPQPVRFDRAALPFVDWVPTRPNWSTWALEDLDARAEQILTGPDAPARTADVVNWIAQGDRSSWTALHTGLAAQADGPVDDQTLADAVLTAWELGFVRPVAPSA